MHTLTGNDAATLTPSVRQHLGKAVVAMMVEEGPGARFRWMLHTSDAYGLYRQFGFEPPPDNYMERP
ncbi:MAG TPA: hypothetical protein VGI96_09210, partial [Streptosporangiaceae bacterium]